MMNKRYIELKLGDTLIQVDLFLGHIIFKFLLDKDTLLDLIYNDTADDKVFYNYDERIEEIYVENYLFIRHINEEHVPHGFQKNDDTDIFYAHTNSGAKVEKENDFYKLTDEFGNIKYFKKYDDLYYLIKKNNVEVVRDNDNNITKLICKEKNIDVDYLGDVDRIISDYKLEFNNDKLISSITYQDINYKFNYYEGDFHKIKEILEYGNGNLIYKYALTYNKTQVKFSRNDEVKLLEFDFLGNLLSEEKLECVQE